MTAPQPSPPGRQDGTTLKEEAIRLGFVDAETFGTGLFSP